MNRPADADPNTAPNIIEVPQDGEAADERAGDGIGEQEDAPSE